MRREEMKRDEAAFTLEPFIHERGEKDERRVEKVFVLRHQRQLESDSFRVTAS